MGTELPHSQLVVRTATGLLLAAVLCMGCQRGGYDASALPVELMAVPTIDVRALDLSRLASSTATSQRIHAGDTLSMTVVTGAEDRQPESWPLRVNDDGTVQVPLVGPIQLAGLDLQTAQNVVRTASIERGIYRQPSVALSVDERQTNRVTVLGAVEEPGAYDLAMSNSDLLAALSSAGGLSENASQIVEIRQPGLAAPSTLNSQPGNLAATPTIQVGFDQTLGVPATQAMRVDLVSATQSPIATGYNLRDGAVVMVRQRPPRHIHVLGLVNRPDQFELPYNQDVRVLDAIAMAGGRTLSAADHVLVLRQTPFDTEPALIELSVRDAKSDSSSNILLTPGDVVSVEETPVTLLLSALQQFIRVGVNGTATVF